MECSSMKKAHSSPGGEEYAPGDRKSG